MAATCTIATFTDPISTLNETTVTAAGTCTALNTVTVTIVDSAGTTVGPVSATVSGTGWSIAATNVSSLLDGTLIYEATSSDGAASAFAAKAAQKQTAALDYITEQEFLDYIKSQADTGNPTTIAAITAASRAVEAFCGRVFYQRVATTKYFSPNYYSVVLDIDDLATTSALVVKADTNQDGTYTTTLTAGTDFILEPRNQQLGDIPGWPYIRLRGRALFTFPFLYYPWQQDTVRITGTFGWPAIPEPVTQATKIIAAMYYKLAEAPFGVAGWGAYGEIRVRDIPQAATLLAPYRKGSSFGIA